MLGPQDPDSSSQLDDRGRFLNGRRVVVSRSVSVSVSVVVVAAAGAFAMRVGGDGILLIR